MSYLLIFSGIFSAASFTPLRGSTLSFFLCRSSKSDICLFANSIFLLSRSSWLKAELDFFCEEKENRPEKSSQHDARHIRGWDLSKEKRARGGWGAIIHHRRTSLQFLFPSSLSVALFRSPQLLPECCYSLPHLFTFGTNFGDKPTCASCVSRISFSNSFFVSFK